MTARNPPGDDRGFTIIELVVSMTIMSIVMAVVIAAIAQIYSATTRVDTASYDRAQLTIAFRRLDAEMRYATWLSTPGLVGGNYYAEYAVPNSGCRELKFGSGVLTLYSWVLPSTTPTSPVALASNLTLISGVLPFTTYAVGATPFASASADTAGLGKGYAPQFSQLRVRFNAATGPTTVPFDTIFTAENTNANTATSNDCSKGRPTS